jgi:predicted GH43/DUF377 family glycosyl hydrolase
MELGEAGAHLAARRVDDKDAALFPKKIGGKYVFLHRLGSEIWIDAVDDLNFDGKKFLGRENI